MRRGEPRSAADYDGRSSAAVKSVIVEIGQILGSYRGKYTIVGGSVPWLLLEDAEMAHVGTQDLDLNLDPVALDDGEYALLVESLLEKGYEQSASLAKFQLQREIDLEDGGQPVKVIIDFLMPRDSAVAKKGPKLIEGFAVQKANGADLGVAYQEMIEVAGRMPGGGTNRVTIAVCTIPAFLAMKGYALDGRMKAKDAYDIYYVLRNYPGGVTALAEACRPLLDEPSGNEGFSLIDAKFETLESYGPTSVRNFVDETDVLDGRTADEWQQDAFGQIDAWLRALGLRKT
ncbi:hypothetical protein [Parerythrobacter jejuensis]|uniref:Nucleotidyl transferase AbiEii/AbiGii toxin family protein n=1 Tax=Parerythrobacter jejuensis TaxID=795812 RepID=A0A845AK53_9SPHN|nr:hypothetical protein [Parerythrobacter jejuensis]MXP30640.1 hypothetical protein [Parerythrobacter jejuensis]MXP33400.1 hypothetical protein [Parerythrobacter jejuensis]